MKLAPILALGIGLFGLTSSVQAQSKKELKRQLAAQTVKIDSLENQVLTHKNRLDKAEEQQLALSKQLKLRDEQDLNRQKQMDELLTQIKAQNERLHVLEKGSAAKYLAPEKQAKNEGGSGGSQVVDKLTQISFSEKSFDFGDIKMGSQVTHEFVIKNVGKEPLLIERAMGSCGCTIPEYPQTPIAPGEKGILKVHFNSNGKSGVQRNTVTIWSNTEPAESRLEITANVKN